MKILIVEDNENLRLALADNLVQEGYQTFACGTGEQAAGILEQQDIKLIVLDIMLPGADGYTLCRQWRDAGCQAMILMLTARSLEEDIVRGFTAGADDYIVKPYRLAEFLLRVKALLRRGSNSGNLPVVLPGFIIDRQAMKITDSSGREIELTRKEFALLECLIRNRNCAMTRDRILDEVWGKEVVVDARTVDNFVYNIRRKLNWRPDNRYRIVPLRGIGYRMEIDD